MTRRIFVALLFCLACSIAPAVAQTSGDRADDAELKFVVYFSRHGVRSPTGKSAQYNVYSSAPWPTWEVEPGILTPHGYELMQRFGEFDRLQLARQGLFHAGCVDAARVTFVADSDQRTRETGKALAAGMFPGCDVPVRARDEGVNDPLFHATGGAVTVDSAQAVAAIAGRIGGDAESLKAAYRVQLTALDTILATCGVATTGAMRTSLLDVPASLGPGKADHAAELRGPLSSASTLAENLLLEYAQGMDTKDVGWGCVDGLKVRSFIDLHTAAVDVTQRTPAIARMQGSNLVNKIELSLEQAATGKAVPGALGRVGDEALFLVGHDTNLDNMAGMLGLDWIADGRRDDTPPGSTLAFELWKSKVSGEMRVRVWFEAQTLEQMRSGAVLSLEKPPVRVPVFVPGCGQADMSCTWKDFSRTLRQSVDARYVVTP